MAYRLSEASLNTALQHLSRYGDTDVFPHLPELAFVRGDQANVVDELKNLDLDQYNPGGAVEALAPKSRYGFRIVHQLPLVDTLLLLACVIEIGPQIEGYRPPVTGIEAFSYRFSQGKSGGIFAANHTYKDWLNAQLAYVTGNLKVKTVVYTDISDFYARINFHRLDNLLAEVAPNHGAAKFIKKHIKAIRAKQSFGLPVGGSAARLLAELALADTDRALIDYGVKATRFVDDFRIFLGAGENPYDVLGFLAGHLGINEGLSLNVAKTYVSTRAEFLSKVKGMTTDVSEEAQGVALEVITSSLYFDDEPDPEDVEALSNFHLLSLLNDELSKESYDMGRIRVIFRALRISTPEDAVKFVQDNFSELVVFAKETVLLMDALENDYPDCFDEMTDLVVEAILKPPAASVQLIRTWLLELFVRNIVPISAKKVRELEGLPSPSDKRQLLLIRGVNEDKNYFRMNKTGFSNYSTFEQPCLIGAASCLPKDEFESWTQNIRTQYTSPLGGLYLQWCKANREGLVETLALSAEDHPE